MPAITRGRDEDRENGETISFASEIRATATMKIPTATRIFSTLTADMEKEWLLPKQKPHHFPVEIGHVAGSSPDLSPSADCLAPQICGSFRA